MDGPRDYRTKQHKSESERQIPYDITYMWNLKFDTNQHIYETKTDSHTQRAQRLESGRGGVGEGWIESLGLADANWYIQNR